MEGIINVMLVEFIGLPGTGKSKLASKIELKRDKDTKVIYPLKDVYTYPWFLRNLFKTLQSSVFWLTHPIKSWKLLNAILKYKQKNKFNYIRLFMNNTYFICVQNKYKYSNAIVIFDEGLVHHLWGIMANTDNESLPKDLLSMYEFPNLIIKIDVNEESIRERIGERKYNKRHNKILDNFTNEQKKINKLYKEVISYISNENTIYSLSLKNEKLNDLNNNIDKINLEIEKYLENLLGRKE